jgi:hypothetical protein
MEIRERDDGELRDRPTSQLVHEFFDETKRVLAEGTRLLRAEIETARDEIRREAKKIGAPAAMAGSGGVLLHAAVLMLAVALGALLAEAMPTWIAFLLTAVVTGIAGWVLLSIARKRIATVALKPETTIHNLQEDQRWARGLTQSARSNLQHDT